jgi:branched-chain amino acid transport system ATP-binding protein
VNSPQTTVNVIKTENLNVAIGGSHVLQDVSLTIPKGGVTALIGRNGVGKTTTLRALIGLQPSAGSIEINGIDVTGWPVHRIIRLGIGYVPEDRDVFTGLTVRENLRLAEISRQEPDYDRVYRLFPELDKRGGQLAGTLSGGQQQMLAIGRVLLNARARPLLLVDEPTKGLAPRFVSEVVDVLEQVSQLETILLVEQNVHVIRTLATRIIVLDHGQVVHAGGAADLADADLARRLLGVSG